MKIKHQIIDLIGKNCILIVLIVLIVTGTIFSKYKYNDVYKDAHSLSHIVASYIDADEMLEYAKTLKTDDAYYQTQKKLEKLKSYFPDCLYMYVFVVEDDELTYIYDIYTEEEQKNDKDEAAALGEKEEIDRTQLKLVNNIQDIEDKIGKMDIDVFNKYGALVGLYLPVYASDGVSKVYVGIDYSIMDYVSLVLWMSLNVLILLILAGACLMYFAVKKINKKFVEPIEMISQKANLFANSAHNGDSSSYHIPTKEGSENEFDILSNDMNKMMDDIDSYIRNIEKITAERERIGTELLLANKIQKGSLPSTFPPFPEHMEFDVYALMNPAKEVGGDFYDFFLIDQTHLALVIADVSGKGVGAALFMMISKTLINNQTMYAPSPSQVLSQVNERICEHNEADMFVTVWLGILDLSTGIMTCANAGHEYPALKRKNGEFELYKDKHGFVIGGLTNLNFKDYEIQFYNGDILYVYTDGVTEATNSHKELFGTDRMLEALNRQKDKNVENILHGMVDEISAFVQDAEQFDDITMLAFEYKGGKNSLSI